MHYDVIRTRLVHIGKRLAALPWAAWSRVIGGAIYRLILYCPFVILALELILYVWWIVVPTLLVLIISQTYPIFFFLCVRAWTAICDACASPSATYRRIYASLAHSKSHGSRSRRNICGTQNARALRKGSSFCKNKFRRVRSSIYTFKNVTSRKIVSYYRFLVKRIRSNITTCLKAATYIFNWTCNKIVDTCSTLITLSRCQLEKSINYIIKMAIPLMKRKSKSLVNLLKHAYTVQKKSMGRFLIRLTVYKRQKMRMMWNKITSTKITLSCLPEDIGNWYRTKTNPVVPCTINEYTLASSNQVHLVLCRDCFENNSHFLQVSSSDEDNKSIDDACPFFNGSMDHPKSIVQDFSKVPNSYGYHGQQDGGGTYRSLSFPYIGSSSFTEIPQTSRSLYTHYDIDANDVIETESENSDVMSSEGHVCKACSIKESLSTCTIGRAIVSDSNTYCENYKQTTSKPSPLRFCDFPKEGATVTKRKSTFFVRNLHIIDILGPVEALFATFLTRLLTKHFHM